MALDRLTKITGPGIKTDTNWVGNNANFTGVTTTGSSFNVGVSTFHSTLAEVHNIKSTGIITATGGSFSGNVTAVDGTFTGNVSIAGTLTYEDVTNIDSVGIITAPAVDVDDFLDVGSNIKLGNAGVVTATTFSGSGASLTGIANANISASAAIAGSKINPNFGSQLIQTTGSIVGNGVQSTANLSLDSDVPTINFNDSNSENDFELKNNNGTFTLRDKDAGADRFTVSSAGQFTFATNVDFSSGIDVTGNATVSGDIDVDGHTNLDNVSIAGVTTFTGAIDANGDLDVDGHTNLDNVSIAGVTTCARIDTNTINVSAHSDIRFASGNWSGNTTKIQNHNNYLYIVGPSNGFQFRIGATDLWLMDSISNDGNFWPTVDSGRDIGKSNRRIRNLYATTLYGDGSNLTGITQTTINSNTNNYLITGSGTANTLNGEANLTFDGTTLTTNGSGGINISASGSDLTMNSAGGIFTGNGGNATNPIVANVSDTNTGFFYPAADTIAVTTGGSERIRIDSSGHLHTGYTSSFGNDHINILASDGGGIAIASNNVGNATTGDILGSLSFQGYLSGAGYGSAEARISAIVSANHTGSSAATDMVFYTKPSSTGPGSAPSERARIASDGKMGLGVTDPKSLLHLGSTGDIRFGSQYGGFAHINQQVQYAAGYTGTHWMFESNNMISWCFDGVLIVYGGGGSSYGSEVTKITIVYSRENGANNSGDMWRNGTTSYNIETLGHAQVGLNPGAGSLTTSEDTAPDGAASQRSLFKLGWTTSGHGGATTTWSKLHGTMYWGQGVGYGSVEVQDKDGNIFWNSNP